MGDNTTSRQQKAEEITSNENLTDDEIFLALFQLLTDEEQDEILSLLQSLSEQQEQTESC